VKTISLSLFLRWISLTQ